MHKRVIFLIETNDNITFEKMKKFENNDGWVLGFSTKKEEENLMSAISTDINPTGKDIALYTPKDNLEYFIDKEVEKSGDNVQYHLRANNKTKKVTCSFYNSDSVINRNVRKMYK